ncbi:TPA: dATP/dGTP pyrophosphohydrolase domain-containing protein [Raoultella ornithinolytica]
MVMRDSDDEELESLPLYRRAQPAPERDQVRSEHAEWSQATFGNVGPVGPLKHLSKEALEAAAEPDDLSEWADMQFLLWDAQRRAGITDEQITQAMIEKLAVNKLRDWPEPKDGEPRLHIKEQPALVIPDVISLEKVAEMTAARGAEYSIRDGIIAAKWWNACRAAMLAAAPHDTPALNSLQSVDSVADRWIPVSERMPENDGAYLCWDNRYVTTYAFIFGAWQANQFIAKNITHWMPLPAAPQEVNRE